MLYKWYSLQVFSSAYVWRVADKCALGTGPYPCLMGLWRSTFLSQTQWQIWHEFKYVRWIIGYSVVQLIIYSLCKVTHLPAAVIFSFSRLGKPLGNVSAYHSSNRETMVEIDDSVRGRDAFILQTGTKWVKIGRQNAWLIEWYTYRI